ncbi:cupin domain-containing protein [Cellvibrio fontiphilus]|uniref:Cupin domain-containing protein n=1 Tax=Cellvibrio fontiphilus TaxID=1815559 RepID=A0ABV7FK16_9GAMM
MLINADFTQRVSITPDQYHWVASPQPGVERVMLDRIGAEKARATSIVRYAPDSFFPAHSHDAGEEILVLEGTFSEDAQSFRAGWYLRNPPGSSHQPSSLQGALIFVKLGQMPASETQPLRINTNTPELWQAQADRQLCPLFASTYEQVCLQRLTTGCLLFNGAIQSAELLVLTGDLVETDKVYPAGSWLRLRLPTGHYPHLAAGQNGATIYLKTGHLESRNE